MQLGVDKESNHIASTQRAAMAEVIKNRPMLASLCSARSLGDIFRIKAGLSPPAHPTPRPVDWISVYCHKETESCSELTGYCVVRSRRRSPVLASAESKETYLLGV